MTEPTASAPRTRWVHGPAAPALVFLTSAAVLVLEILAGRLVAPYIGVSLEAYTGIIGTVLAGIALGSAAGGWVADRRDPATLLGPVLVASGVAALASLPIITTLGPAVAGTGGTADAIVLLAASAFVLPTALLSAVTPMVTKLRLASTAETGTIVGGLSAAGTAGALAGTFLTGFVFIAAWPTRPIVVGVGAALMLLGVVLTVISGKRWGSGSTLAVLVLAPAPVLALAVPAPCERETRYHCALVAVDPLRPFGRLLVLDDLRHSYVDLDDPTYLEFRYARLFADVVDAALGERPIDALHIGGGGFTMPRWISATRPGSTSTVLEVDPGIVDIGVDELGLELRDPDLRARVGDARLTIGDEDDDAYDLVVGDAFGGLSVPWHLTTIEMVTEVDRVLRDDGVYVLNVIDAGPRGLVRAELATLAGRFEHLAVIVPPDGPAGNHVLVASDRPMDIAEPQPDEGRLVVGAALERFIGGAEPLRDDFAPADQLLSRG